MSLKIVDEEYNGLAALYANAGKWITGQIKVANEYYVGSGTSVPFIANGNTITRDSGSWGTDGFVPGDSITISFQSNLPGANGGLKSYTRIITYINGSILYLDSALPSPFTNLTFPTSGKVAGMAISADKLPQQIDMIFNLVQNGTQSEQSLIDGEVNRFKCDTVQSLAVLGNATMVQQSNKSGGIFKTVTITRTANTGTGGRVKNFTIDFVFNQWLLFESTVYTAANCPVPYVQAKSYSLVGNPNGVLTDTNGANEANTGLRNENYNGGVNVYELDNISFLDDTLNPITKPDYSSPFDFTAVINAPGQVNGSSNYRIGLAFLPETDSLFKNKLSSAGNNLMLNAPDVNFQHSASIDPTVYSGLENNDNAGFDFSNLKFFHNTGVVTVTGRITPKGGNVAFFDELADGERKLIIWVQLSNYLQTGTANNEVNLTVWEGDCFNAPTIGIQIPDITSQILLDHGGQDITVSTTPNTTTEDDMLYTAKFLLKDNEEYEAIRVGISARNTVTGESFELENQTISFDNVPFVLGKHVPNVNIPRGFLLPPTSDRNAITLTRDSSIDVGTKYGLQLNYGFMNNWRYWQEQSNVPNDFFNTSEMFNGKNKNWRRFFNGDWLLSVDLYTIKNEVENFNHFTYKIRPYEDEPTVTATATITSPNGTTPTNFEANAVSKLDVVFNWNKAFSEEWAQITIENKEGARLGMISSVRDQGGVANNPLKPIAGQTKLALTNGGNTLTAKCLVDSALLNGDISLTYRAFSLPKGTLGYLVQTLKDADRAYSLQKISPNDVYNGKALTLRRVSDSATIDVYFVNNELDLTLAIPFAMGGNLAITWQADQSGNGFHRTQVDPAKQPLLIIAGVLNVSINGYAAIKYDGINDYFDMSAMNNNGNILQTWVFDNTENITHHSVGNVAGNASLGFWNKATNEVYSGVNGTNLLFATDAAVGDLLLTTIHGSNSTNMYINGIAYGAQADPFVVKTFDTTGRYGINYTKGNEQELVVWRIDKTAQLAAIHANIKPRYGL